MSSFYNFLFNFLIILSASDPFSFRRVARRPRLLTVCSVGSPASVTLSLFALSGRPTASAPLGSPCRVARRRRKLVRDVFGSPDGAGNSSVAFSGRPPAPETLPWPRRVARRPSRSVSRPFGQPCAIPYIYIRARGPTACPGGTRVRPGVRGRPPWVRWFLLWSRDVRVTPTSRCDFALTG